MLVSVALSVPLFHGFTYAVPRDTPMPLPGTRVLVPWRRGREIGVVLGPTDVVPTGVQLRSISRVLDAADRPAVPESLLALATWIADYYVAPIGQVLRAALPTVLWSTAKPAPTGRTQRVAEIALELPSLLDREQRFARAPKQRALYELLESSGGRAPVARLLEQLGVTNGVVDALAKKGIVRLIDAEQLRDPFAERAAVTLPPTPTPAQRRIVEALTGAPPGTSALLHGITGSGKTLVYIEVLRHIVRTLGRTAIVLVPEIALTPQTVDRFRAAFGDDIAVLHSALSDGERFDAWRALRRGDKRIAVGARSALFAPLDDLGVVIVDEEHEASYKQAETPRYHARDAALVRAKAAGALCVLGSATPSLETWQGAADGRHEHFTLTERAGGGALPPVRVVDLRAARRVAAAERRRAPGQDAPSAYAGIVTAPLDSALRARLTRGEQSLLLLNRRGYAAFVQCDECGAPATCPHCSISLTYHRIPEGLACHYCGHREPMATSCPVCNGTRLARRGLGTQQVERAVAEEFPEARIARMDVDTTTGKWAHAEILDRVGRGEVDILLGTQMIAKGLDFPNVTLVGVLDADTGINLPDFRASERCFQLLSQVAGRAGRGPKGGEVIIQTRVPEHHAVRCALAHDYHAFVREELSARRVPVYPPFVRVANVLVSGLEQRAVAACAASVSTWLAELIAARRVEGLTLVGPAPSPIEKIKDRWRWHLLVKADAKAPMARVLRYFLERVPVPAAHDLRVVVDRDPVQLL
ncbi:MAG: primosomal protein N' [Gemmatimonadaceae bacterium]|nr:primosomal protein N' [Gemmatimonadaceae bacterium]